MERRHREVQVLNYIVPIVMYCAVVAGETSKCDGTTKIYSETLDAVETPTKCLLEGYIRAAQYIDDWQKDHPNKPLEYRVKCQRPGQKI